MSFLETVEMFPIQGVEFDMSFLRRETIFEKDLVVP
jgi:hypothetical protein